MNKRGISEIIISVLLILLSIIAIIILWQVLKHVVNVDADTTRLTIDLEIKSASFANNFSSITIQRNPGQGNITKLAMSFEGDSKSYAIRINSTIKELQLQTYYVNLTGKITTLEKIRIAPIIITAKGKEVLGSVVAIYVFGAESIAAQCTPANNPCSGIVCGQVSNGTCGIINCPNTCTPEQTCISNQCQSATCTPETESEFCSRLGKNCDSLTATDNCGNSRTVASCGSCSSGYICNNGVCQSTSPQPCITIPGHSPSSICALSYNWPTGVNINDLTFNHDPCFPLGMHLCNGAEIQMYAVTTAQAVGIGGCFAYNGANDDNVCHQLCSSSWDDLGGIGNNCGDWTGISGCIQGGRIDAVGWNSGCTKGVVNRPDLNPDLWNNVNGVVCCMDIV